jgi:hypothetical protein
VPKRKPLGKSFLFNEPICGVVVITSNKLLCDKETVINEESKRENRKYFILISIDDDMIAF